jgi:hypothetical protein
MYDPAWSEGKPVDTEVTEGVVGGGVEAAKAVGGVGEDTGACWECTEGVEGSGWGVRWGVGICGAGGVRECTMGGVWPMLRFTGGRWAMCGCEETTTGEPCG